MDSGGSSTEVAFDCDLFRLYKDGRVERAGVTELTVPAGLDADTGVISKDVVIDGVAARLYMPSVKTGAAKLPVLVFFHGGYFVVASPWHPAFHRYVNSLVAAARVVAVSVRYRLAPENVLPAAYDDAWTALNWVASGSDPWLSGYGDLSRVYLSGTSAGANIAHNLAIAAGVNGLRGGAAEPAPRVEGVILLHPSFAGEQRMEAEQEEFCRANKNRWMAIFPGAKDGLEDPRINPMAAGAPSLAKLAGERMLVCTASEDPRAPRGRAYCDAIQASGWSGKLERFETPGEGHCFFVLDHTGHEAVKLMDLLVAFLATHP